MSGSRRRNWLRAWLQPRGLSLCSDEPRAFRFYAVLTLAEVLYLRLLWGTLVIIYNLSLFLKLADRLEACVEDLQLGHLHLRDPFYQAPLSQLGF